ncbi:RNA 2',3'-cyclic phosphodiesterase [Paludibacter jiangxiensis]|uniref:RNA 2',3'-cyclic phosphodiesterase n=1 Tax=Paludibacter jiangxiensis TaxID=681398 RepID=A0A171AI13_9BACT|nr:RNA 2',3'-cyclic phosphodiesterase [Paludibacter jiangxiensis]GAT63769.1 2'-5' RNA ligase [Paludibacter jiangxiensis]
MKTKRVFLAIPYNGETLVTEAINQLKSDLSDYRIRWISTDDLHLTLFFFGQISTQQVSVIQDTIFAITDNLRSFTFAINSTGIFYSERNPRVLWLGIDKSDSLIALKNEIDQALASIGFFADKQPFVPHITVGRFASRQIATPQLVNTIDEMTNMLPIVCKGQSVVLYESILSPDGSQYKPIETFRLNDSALEKET